MSDRYTKQHAKAAFERLIDAIGGRVATAYNDIDAYALDHNSVYGGFVIEKINNSGGGVSQPFGSSRQSAREFCQSVRFALDTLREKGSDS